MEIAIGTKMAPSYAIIFICDLEEKLLKDCDKKLDDDVLML